jgi:hypothetical protein
MDIQYLQGYEFVNHDKLYPKAACGENRAVFENPKYLLC